MKFTNLYNKKGVKTHDALFDEIYQTYSGRIYNYVMKLTSGNTYYSEEVLQMTFLRLWEKRNELYDFSDTQAYLFVTAKHILLNMLDHEMISHVYTDYLSKYSTEEDTTTEDEIQYQFMMESVMKVIDQMSPMRQKVFMMSKFDNKTHAEIANELNISVSMVEKHIMQAVRLMRIMLKTQISCLLLILLF